MGQIQKISLSSTLKSNFSTTVAEGDITGLTIKVPRTKYYDIIFNGVNYLPGNVGAYFSIAVNSNKIMTPCFAFGPTGKRDIITLIRLSVFLSWGDVVSIRQIYDTGTTTILTGAYLQIKES